MRKFILSLFVLACSASAVSAGYEALDPSSCKEINAILKELKPSNLQIGKVEADTVLIDRNKKRVKMDMSGSYGYIPEIEQYTESVKERVSSVLGGQYSFEITVGGRPVENYYIDAPLKYTGKKEKTPFVYPLDGLRHPQKGLDGKIIALWQSHGFYFEPKEDRWEWQRARIFQTVEDLFPQSFVIPFLMPMLENAGAYVMSPRERDTKSVELILDNDAQGALEETDGEQPWEAGGTGFGYQKGRIYRDFENPFKDGTYRKVKTTKGKQESTAVWKAEIPAAGSYAVYVSYATVPGSTKDALYTVHAAGGDQSFRINQQMGGGTWIYLGHFDFKEGRQNIVSLTNKSSKKNAVLTADAVKVGGGFGNVARKVQGEVSDNVKSAEADSRKAEVRRSRINSEYRLSGYPRYTEAARYWLQWAGVPDSVYSPSHGVNDYTDDYRCRGLWVNYLAGGSSVLPEAEGLNIPVDLAFAFHTDAGTTKNDSIIGTLGIYYSNKGGKYANGTERMNSHQLTDHIMTNIVNDVRAKYDSNWTRRGMWDASYYEARVPEVPTMLLELLSHQNFADMRYGLDPTFRFTVSRAIYKGMLEFLAAKEGRTDYVVQPLPVNSFAISKVQDGEYRLSWKATTDSLCDRADATGYVVYERVGDGAFRQIATTSAPEYTVSVADHDIHSYRIVAMNDGGLSFPSETLALGEAAGSKGDVLVVNGFTRVCAPDWFDSGDIAGFYSAHDGGVPYIADINHIGDMFEFRRELPWFDDDSAGFGASRSNYEDKVIAGNTFDFPALHGRSIMAAGYSFVSASAAAVENGTASMTGYRFADLILGKQKETVIGRGEKPNRFKTYPAALQKAISDFCAEGGNIFVTGSYVATGVWDSPGADKATQDFASNVLGYNWRVGQACVEGRAELVSSYFPEFGHLTMDYQSEKNDAFYSIESPDGLIPANSDSGCVLMRYTENNIPAAVANDFGTYKTCVVGFPFETIKDGKVRDALMEQVLDFFDSKK